MFQVERRRALDEVALAVLDGCRQRQLDITQPNLTERLGIDLDMPGRASREELSRQLRYAKHPCPHVVELYSYGLYSYGLCSYGLYNYGFGMPNTHAGTLSTPTAAF